MGSIHPARRQPRDARHQPLSGTRAVAPPAVRHRSDDVRGVHHDGRAHIEKSPQQIPRPREARVERPVRDLVERDPRQLAALRVTDRGLERLHDIADERRVGPDIQIEHAEQARPDRPVRNTRLLLRLAQRTVAGRLPLVSRAAGKCPCVAEVAPRHAMLQQHAAARIQRQETRRTEPSPVPLT